MKNKKPVIPLMLEMHGGIATHGEYFVKVDLGEPIGQQVKVQVDSGSSSFIVSTDSYSEYKSSTAHEVSCEDPKYCQSYSCDDIMCRSELCSPINRGCCSLSDTEKCGFFLEYGGNTQYHVGASGVLVRDKAKLLSISGKNWTEQIVIYKVRTRQGTWPSNVDGILGLAFPRLSCNPTCSPLAFESGIFSMCMGDHRGILLLGSDGTEERMSVGDVQYVPIISTFMPTYFIVKLDSIKIEDSVLERSRFVHHAIIDSGTTLLLLEQDLWLDFVEEMKSHLCWLPGVCTRREDSLFQPGVCLSAFPKRRLPMLSLSLGGVLLEIPPSAYFVKYVSGGQSVYCLGIQSAGAERTVIGDTVLRLYHAVYDKSNMRVGFAVPNTTTCGTLDISSSQGTLRPMDQPWRDSPQYLERMVFFAGIALVVASVIAFVILSIVSFNSLYSASH